MDSASRVLATQKRRYHALACDYDGTLATHGRISSDVIKALERFAETGRKLLLVTGRRLEDLFKDFRQADLFDYLVCENGAVLYRPATKVAKMLAEPVPRSFIEALQRKNMTPLEIGHVIVATWHPNENIVLETIQELGLDLKITFNKGAVMILPSGINKASGLLAAVSELGLSRHNVVAVGDAENDHVLLSVSECSFAVANALPSLKEYADVTTKADHGAGVIEVIERLLVNDLEDCEQLVHRHDIVLGTAHDGVEVKFRPYHYGLLLAGPSQSGKSTVCMSLLEHLAGAGYQYCVIDPEGDYERAPRAVMVGNRHYGPDADDALRVLENPDENVVINLLGMSLEERPQFLHNLLPRIHKMRRMTGRPHWIVIDEAHHMLHPYWNSTLKPAWYDSGAVALVTIDPAEISPIVLATIDLVIAVGNEPEKTLNSFALALGERPPVTGSVHLSWGEALAWYRRQYGSPLRLNIVSSTAERRRHLRKYAEGNLGYEKSFYFTGSDNRLNLRAQNLFIFIQIAEGIDDATWLFHLKRGDYSNWFRDVIRDQVLADQAQALESTSDLSAAESRLRIRELIENRYTSPARLSFT